MNEFDLVGQLAREMNYWMADPVAYVDDVREGYIPASVYPDWQANRHIPPFNDPGGLTEEGFTKGGSTENGGFPNLGARKRKNPLLALDALLMRMIATGIAIRALESGERSFR